MAIHIMETWKSHGMDYLDFKNDNFFFLSCLEAKIKKGDNVLKCMLSTTSLANYMKIYLHYSNMVQSKHCPSNVLHRVHMEDTLAWEYDLYSKIGYSHVLADATSDYATGAVLSMKDDDGKWHPCAYLSKGLNDIE